MAVAWTLVALLGAAAAWAVVRRRAPTALPGPRTAERRARFDTMAGELGRQFGLQPVRQQRTASEWRGTVDGVEVSVVAYPGSLTVRTYTGSTATEEWEISGRRSEDGVPTGDPGFDAVISVTGTDTPDSAALLDATTRAQLIEALPARPTEGKPWFMSIKPDRVTAMATGASIDAAMGATMLEYAVRLSNTRNEARQAPLERLGAIARSDLVDAVRARAMETVSVHFSQRHAARDLAADLVVTGTPGVRWWAAQMLGDGYRDALVQAAGELLMSASTPETMLATVTGQVLRDQPEERAPLLPALAAACTRHAGVANAALAVLAAEAGRGAVEPLMVLEERGGPLGRRARDAIASIQARIPGGGLGHLAITESVGTGGLSVESEVASQAEGALSVEEESA